jgi:cbb3-type cytochrome oxidase maturation protein
MNVILYLLGASLLLGGGALAIFLWSLRSGQYDDMEGAANRILFDDEEATSGRFRAPLSRPSPDGQRPNDRLQNNCRTN